MEAGRGKEGAMREETAKHSMTGGRFAAPAYRWRFLAGLVAMTASLSAQESYKKPISVGEPPADHSPAAELASFKVLDGFAVNLFADETDGIANALVIRWDERGRLWCLQTSAYPQPAPDELANDQVIILEDTDGDGRADKRTVWADGLRMPMGMELGGPGELIVGEGEKLLRLTDTDGDDRADRRETIFSGFGTGDTHQNLNSFIWSPDGTLVMHQGLHCYSRVVTAHGVVQLYGAGFWRWWPRSGRLEAYPTGMPLNPWGTAFTKEGQPIQVAGAAGMFWARPMEVSVPEIPPEQAGGKGEAAGLPYFLLSRFMLPHSGQIIKTAGLRKFCGVDIPGNSHWPEAMQGEIVTGGFFENAIYRHKLIDDKDNPSGFEAVEQTPLITSDNVAFRPVDVRFGPDGALYIADWYNPIIGHYQASFRHPNRDRQHGRIWRVTVKDRPLLAKPKIATTSQGWVEQLGSTDRWTAYQAWRLLRASPELAETRAADPATALLLQTAVEVPDVDLLRSELEAPESARRERAVQALGSSSVPESLTLLARAIADPQPRVRLEAIVALAKLKSADALRTALKALDAPMDSFLDRALWLTVHATAAQWKKPETLDAFLAALPSAHLSYLVEKDGSRELLDAARAMLGREGLAASTRLALHGILIRKGDVEDQRRALEAGMHDIAVLTTLTTTLAVQAKAQAPEGALAKIQQLLASASEDRRIAACELAAVWRLQAVTPAIRDLAAGVRSYPVRTTAIRALARLGETPERFLGWLQDSQETWLIRVAALTALAEVQPARAGSEAAALLDGLAVHDETSLTAALSPLLARPASTQALAKALEAKPCSKETAGRIQTLLAAAGQSDAILLAALGKIVGTKNIQPAYDPAWVAALADEVKAAGNAEKGRAVFQQPLFACTACHQIGGQGGIIGPELDSVGRGVPVELLIEAVVWPGRQIKEGYVATSVSLKDGRRLQGYKVSEGGGELQLKDLGSGQVSRFALAEIQEHQESGSLMPEGLIVNMTREELRDLIAYLASLGR
jgi:putative membrane-bound dehydrogenase-like protein